MQSINQVNQKGATTMKNIIKNKTVKRRKKITHDRQYYIP